MLIDATKHGPAALVGGGYESDMPGFADTLSDTEIRAILAYVKSTWPERQRKIESERSRAHARRPAHRAVLLNVWATWCPPCVEEMPTLDALQTERGGQGLEVVALSIDRAGPELVRAFFERTGAGSGASFSGRVPERRINAGACEVQPHD